MGQLILHDWARLLAIVSATFSFWASLWAFAYRKFFWDFVGGQLGPEGLVAQGKAKLFVKIIVDLPLVQVVNLILSMITLTIEYPCIRPPPTGSIVCNLKVRVGWYLVSAFLALLVYQSVDAGVFYAITAVVYGIAIAKGETIQSTNEEEGTVKNKAQRV